MNEENIKRINEELSFLLIVRKELSGYQCGYHLKLDKILKIKIQELNKIIGMYND